MSAKISAGTLLEGIKRMSCAEGEEEDVGRGVSRGQGARASADVRPHPDVCVWASAYVALCVRQVEGVVQGLGARTERRQTDTHSHTPQAECLRRRRAVVIASSSSPLIASTSGVGGEGERERG